MKLSTFKKLAGFMTDGELAVYLKIDRKTVIRYRKLYGIAGRKPGRPKNSTKLKIK